MITEVSSCGSGGGWCGEALCPSHLSCWSCTGASQGFWVLFIPSSLLCEPGVTRDLKHQGCCIVCVAWPRLECLAIAGKIEVASVLLTLQPRWRSQLGSCTRCCPGAHSKAFGGLQRLLGKQRSQRGVGQHISDVLRVVQVR